MEHTINNSLFTPWFHQCTTRCLIIAQGDALYVFHINSSQ